MEKKKEKTRPVKKGRAKKTVKSECAALLHTCWCQTFCCEQQFNDVILEYCTAIPLLVSYNEEKAETTTLSAVCIYICTCMDFLNK